MKDFPEQTEDAFRTEIAEFVATRTDAEMRRTVEQGQPLGKQGYIDWQRKLDERGWAAPHWPVDWGGTDWSLRKRFVFDEEMALQGAPHMVGFNTRMIGPILIAYGSDAQKDRFLDRARRFDDWWCQGYSEPSSGSDLASLRTRAVRDGDDYVVNGSKIWTSYGHYANWMFCLVRTDPDAERPQKGISFLLIDMNTPGIKVEPIRHFYGAHIFNQVIFEDVRVPVANRIGAENEGWTIAKALLEHERLTSARHTEARRKFERLLRLSRRGDDASGIRSTIAGLGRQVRALECATMRALEGLIETGKVGTFASPLKLKGIAVNQKLDEAIFDLLGPDALPSAAAHDSEIGDLLAPDGRYVAEARYYFRGPAIAGGSAEVQRGVIAKRILNM